MRDLEAHAKQFIDHILNGGDVYILMSIRDISKDAWISYPYVCMTKEGRKFVTLFSKLEDAKAYVDKYGYDKAFGEYPLSMLPKDISQITKFLFGLNHNRIDLVGFADQESPGTFCDTLHFIQELGAHLNTNVYSRYVDLFPILGHEHDREDLVAQLNVYED